MSSDNRTTSTFHNPKYEKCTFKKEILTLDNYNIQSCNSSFAKDLWILGNICDQCAKEYERHDIEHVNNVHKYVMNVQRSVLICNYNNKHIIIFFSIS